MEEIQERHDAVMGIEKKLLDLQQVNRHWGLSMEDRLTKLTFLMRLLFVRFTLTWQFLLKPKEKFWITLKARFVPVLTSLRVGIFVCIVGRQMCFAWCHVFDGILFRSQLQSLTSSQGRLHFKMQRNDRRVHESGHALPL